MVRVITPPPPPPRHPIPSRSYRTPPLTTTTFCFEIRAIVLRIRYKFDAEGNEFLGDVVTSQHVTVVQDSILFVSEL